MQETISPYRHQLWQCRIQERITWLSDGKKCTDYGQYCQRYCPEKDGVPQQIDVDPNFRFLIGNRFWFWRNRLLHFHPWRFFFLGFSRLFRLFWFGISAFLNDNLLESCCIRLVFFRLWCWFFCRVKSAWTWDFRFRIVPPSWMRRFFCCPIGFQRLFRWCITCCKFRFWIWHVICDRLWSGLFYWNWFLFLWFLFFFLPCFFLLFWFLYWSWFNWFWFCDNWWFF